MEKNGWQKAPKQISGKNWEVCLYKLFFTWQRSEMMMFNSRNKCEQNLLFGGMISLVGTINKLQGQGRKL